MYIHVGTAWRLKGHNPDLKGFRCVQLHNVWWQQISIPHCSWKKGHLSGVNTTGFYLKCPVVFVFVYIYIHCLFNVSLCLYVHVLLYPKGFLYAIKIIIFINFAPLFILWYSDEPYVNSLLWRLTPSSCRYRMMWFTELSWLFLLALGYL